MTRTVYRRFDASAENGQLSALEDRFLPILGQLAADLLSARVRGDDPWQYAPTLADLTRAGLTAADCLTLIRRDFLLASPSPTGKGQGDGGKEPSPSGSGRGEGGKKPSPSGRGQGEGGVKSRNRQKSSKSAARTKNAPRLHPSTRLLLTGLGLDFITKHAQSSRTVYHPLPPPEARGEGISEQLSSSRSTAHAPRLTPVEGATEEPFYGSTAHAPRPTAHAPRTTQVGGVSQKPSPSGRGQGEGNFDLLSPLLPHYDVDLRELTVAGETIIRLRRQAHNLTAVLTALQLTCWPPQVVKPLNGYPEASDPQHLADAVYGLNQHQSLIEFRSDGPTIRWCWRNGADDRRQPSCGKSASAPRSRKSH